MARILGIFLIFLVFQHGSPRGLPEQAVVSYTTLPSTPPHQHQQDVYHQIANNIAERITSPIYRFLGFGNATASASTTKAPWKDVEILDEPEENTDVMVDNDISSTKDVEELSPEALKKIDRKPEKITLFSSYLPSDKANVVANTTEEDNIETFGFEDDGVEDDSTYKPRDGPFVYILELLGSFFTLIYGGIVSLFSGSRSS
ncbi:uncharacterized protein LOC121727846 [Aricia agestis]|uniref:uncharacterized protein LOC121727846 n=1 Tax=Aricia agestis TaxID=91739 RepID=UPI001C208247|nr:uncharacterized protein LOC121727846 [Aricia agestis]